MKIIPGKYAPFVAAAKSNLSGWYVLLALLFLSVLFSGCEKEDDLIAECWELQATCTLEVTAEKVICGYGAFGNIWLKTADGKLLQPWHSLVDQKSLLDGQKYTVGYKAVERDDKYKDRISCMAALPAAQAVVITCLSATGNN